MVKAFDLTGEIALITGGGTGLGLGIAQCMAEVGARVVLAGRRESVLQEAAEQIGEQATCAVHDVTRFDRASALIAEVTEKVGQPTILVNNAGNHLKKPSVDVTEDEFLGVINTHVTGAFALTRALAPALMKRGSGSIIFISSMAALFGIPRIAAYGAAKSAQLGLVRELAVEWSPQGLRVNAIAPGWIDTKLVAYAMAGDPARKETIIKRTPMHTFGQVEDVGWAAVYLASPAAKFVTGTVLTVDGGMSIGF